MRYFIHLAYRGTKYRGWQRQKKVRSVQAVLEDTINRLFHENNTIHPCGRTDAGVHARQFFAHINTDYIIHEKTVFQLNKMLPDDIVVYDFIDVPQRANAQLDAIERTYHYYVHLDKNPFLEQGSTWVARPQLNIDAMREALQLVQGYQDFRSMCLTPDAHDHTFCKLQAAHIDTQAEGRRLRIRFTADRFLRGMVRLLVARLLDVGVGKIDIATLKTALETGERVRFHTSAKPQGLYLAEVKYPFLMLEPNPLFCDVW